MIKEIAYAKVNLGLEVLRKREDGYHDLAMVMSGISLFDELVFEIIEDNEVIIDCKEMEHIPLKNNLIYKAAFYLKDKFNINKGVKVIVKKQIPEQAGLGGGSADAAATLRGLNRLFNLNLSLDELAKYAIEIGSDVPFCIYNKLAIVTGRGENIKFLNKSLNLNLILIFPPFKAKTKEVFTNFRIHRKNIGKIDKLVDAIKNDDLKGINENIFNDLEESYLYEKIKPIKELLTEKGAITSFMTGSGSTIIGVCASVKEAKSVLNNVLSYNDLLAGIVVQTI